jgi:hypothetical protein
MLRIKVARLYTVGTRIDSILEFASTVMLQAEDFMLSECREAAEVV